MAARPLWGRRRPFLRAGPAGRLRRRRPLSNLLRPMPRASPCLAAGFLTGGAAPWIASDTTANLPLSCLRSALLIPPRQRHDARMTHPGVPPVWNTYQRLPVLYGAKQIEGASAPAGRATPRRILQHLGPGVLPALSLCLLQTDTRAFWAGLRRKAGLWSCRLLPARRGSPFGARWILPNADGSGPSTERRPHPCRLARRPCTTGRRPVNG